VILDPDDHKGRGPSDRHRPVTDRRLDAEVARTPLHPAL